MFLNHPQHAKMSHSPLLVLFNTLQPTLVAIMTKVRRMLLTQLDSSRNMGLKETAAELPRCILLILLQKHQSSHCHSLVY